ncbi:Sterol desaturase/sphingolipid hydroxylase, fatty acid hydroxylase superfamily [Chitinimonas taiwanensis DSM 18899]|uniref:Sterol desaturase/sphingolipid hydroxylase, fatty acid hydroxylase superfamily n=2 Tax=Chitinimonas TaxID=240411 RepID=A0A1K2HRJ1_9NEIS|nr:Sterol desaturase/sphingolipid hydroxylase, fatty acid hydroxylase superfamily [Chitinimonas taiwanensis DSM 18899]
MFSGVGESILISLSLISMLMVLEACSIGWQQSSMRMLLRGGGTAWTDVVSALLVLSNLALIIGTALSFGLIYVLQAWFKQHLDMHWLGHIESPWLAYGIFIIVLDFSNYWVHRWMHRYAILWELHKFHHSATEMTMFTALRDHPLERVVAHGINAIPAALLGVPPQQYILAYLALQALGYLKHSNWCTNWGWFGRWVVQSPAAHRLHHSNHSEHHDCNFSSILQIWDIFFSTSRHPTATEARNVKLGLMDGDNFPMSPLGALVAVVRDFYIRIFHAFLR